MEQSEPPIPLDPSLSVPTAQMATELANEVYPSAPLEAMAPMDGIEMNSETTSQIAPDQTPTQASSRGKGKTKYRVYTEENLKLAVQAILENGMSLRKASQAYGVPKTTIAERVGNRRPPVPLPSTSTRAITKGDGPPNSTTIVTSSSSSRAPQQQEVQIPKSSANITTTTTDQHPTTTTVLITSHGAIPMPTTRFTWTEEAMTAAIAAVQTDGLPIADAARRFGVPPSHLNSRTRGREPKNLKGELSRMTLRQESLLAEWAGAQAALGLPASKDDVYDLAERVVQKHGDGTEKKLGKQWINHWQRRWPHVEVLDWRENSTGDGKGGKRKRRKTEGEDGGGGGGGESSGQLATQGDENQGGDIMEGEQQRQQQQQPRPFTEEGQVEADLMSVQDELQQQLEQEVSAQPELYS